MPIKNKDIRKFIEKHLTRRKTLKNYKLSCLCNFFTIITTVVTVATTCIEEIFSNVLMAYAKNLYNIFYLNLKLLQNMKNYFLLSLIF